MKLVIDIGNTYTKLAVFNDAQLIELLSVVDLVHAHPEQILNKYPLITSVILSSVKGYDSDIDKFLSANTHFVKFDHKTPLPFSNQYGTPTTLGLDRLAAAAGATETAAGLNALIIDAGTCITYDILTAENAYLGGAISPGIHMRFKALNTFTGNLPLINFDQDCEIELIGRSTESSILSGVSKAVIKEVDGMIDEYQTTFNDLRVIVTGGDYAYFDKYLKNSIFAAPNLVLIGLKKILEFNEGS